MLSAVKDGPSYPARVLALEEERFAFAILESEDLAVASDVQLTLLNQERASLVSAHHIWTSKGSSSVSVRWCSGELGERRRKRTFPG